MQINVNMSGERCVIDIDGELDRDTITSNLWEVLSAASQQSIAKAQSLEIDLSKVARADTAGLAWLLNALRDIRVHNNMISISNVPKKLVDLASLSNADQLITKPLTPKPSADETPISKPSIDELSTSGLSASEPPVTEPPTTEPPNKEPPINEKRGQ